MKSMILEFLLFHYADFEVQNKIVKRKLVFRNFNYLGKHKNDNAV
jgi:hypothetical protein